MDYIILFCMLHTQYIVVLLMFDTHKRKKERKEKSRKQELSMKLLLAQSLCFIKRFLAFSIKSKTNYFNLA